MVLPSEMVAESVVNNIQSNSFDADSSNTEFTFQILMAFLSGKIWKKKHITAKSLTDMIGNLFHFRIHVRIVT